MPEREFVRGAAGLVKSFGAPFKWGAVPFGDSFFLNLPTPDLRPGLMNAAALGG